MKKKRKTLKGISLVELVVVMAVFGLIMSTALAMIRPVSDQYNTTAQFTSASASIDSISFYIESQLRYADRLWLYRNYKQGSGSSIEYGEMVKQFSERYCLLPTTKTFNVGVEPNLKEYSITVDRTAVDPYLKDCRIYIMTIHNDNDCKMSDGSKEPRGRVSIDVYKPDGTPVPGESKEFAVAEGFYKNNEFTINLGKAEKNEDGTWMQDNTVDTSNFATTISIYRRQFDKNVGTDGGFVFKDTNLKSVASFGLPNVKGYDNIVFKILSATNADGSPIKNADDSPFTLQYTNITENTYGYNYNANAGDNDWLFKRDFQAPRYEDIACNGTLSDGSEAQDIVFVYTKPKTFK